MRVLIVGGGARGRALARTLIASGHAVRITTRTEAGRAAIEQSGAECWIGTPDRIGSLRYALDGATVLCWLLGCAGGEADALAALHTTRLEFMLSQVIDTTVRGVIYEAAGSVGEGLLAQGAAIAARCTQKNSIPLGLLAHDPGDLGGWTSAAYAAICSLLL